MSDTKIRASDQIKAIHEVLNEYDGEEALKRIREVMYGAPPPDPAPTPVEPWDDEENKHG